MDTKNQIQNRNPHITSISGASGVERFNRTLKEQIQTRLDAIKTSGYTGDSVDERGIKTFGLYNWADDDVNTTTA